MDCFCSGIHCLWLRIYSKTRKRRFDYWATAAIKNKWQKKHAAVNINHDKMVCWKLTISINTSSCRKCVSSAQLELLRTWWWRKIIITIIITALYFTLNEPWKAMSAKLKNPTFSCRLVTAINQIINVLNAIIKQYCLPALCPSCEWF